MADLQIVDKSLRSVFVGNIPYEATEEKLKEIFSQVGQVLSFKLVFDRESGKPKGYGFCEYRDQETALSAMRNLNGFEIGGRTLRVDNACTEKSRLELQDILAGPTSEPQYGDDVEPEKAPEAISKAVASLPPEQMFELMKQMKLCIQNNPHEARTMLLQNPQLSYALLQAQVVMRIVDPVAATNMLHASPKVPPTLFPAENGMKPMERTNQLPSFPTDSNPEPPDPTKSLLNPALRNESSHTPPLPVQPRQQFPDFGRNPPRPEFPSMSGQGPPRPVGPPRMGDKPPGPPPNVVPPPNMVPPRGFPQSGGDFDHRMMNQPGMDRGPPLRDSDIRPMPPRQQQMPLPNRDPPPLSTDTFDRFNSGRNPDNRGMTGPPFGREQRGPSGGPGMDEDMRDVRRDFRMGGPPGPGFDRDSRPSNIPPPPPPQDRRSFDRITPPATPSQGQGQDQEKAALIMQVLQLSDEQIALLPPDQRQSIMLLKDQISRTNPGGTPIPGRP